MKSGMAAMLAAILVVTGILAPASGRAQTATPFPEVPIPQPARRSNVVAYGAMLTGAGLIGASFAFNANANDAYDRYLQETDPVAIDVAYDEAKHYDTLSTASLITGEVLMALGLYLRFLRPTAEPRLGLRLEPTRCALALRF